MSFNYAVIFTVGRNDSRILLLGAAKDETTNRKKVKEVDSSNYRKINYLL